MNCCGAKKAAGSIHRAGVALSNLPLPIRVGRAALTPTLAASPVQVTVLPISDRHLDYARQVERQLSAAGLRVELDGRQEKIGYKIREAQLQKIPYMLVTGDREAAEGTVSVRSRSAGDIGAQALDAFLEMALDEIARKALQPRVAEAAPNDRRTA